MVFLPLMAEPCRPSGHDRDPAQNSDPRAGQIGQTGWSAYLSGDKPVSNGHNHVPLFLLLIINYIFYEAPQNNVESFE